IWPKFLRLTAFAPTDSTNPPHGERRLNGQEPGRNSKDSRGFSGESSGAVSRALTAPRESQMFAPNPPFSLQFVPAIHILPLLVVVSTATPTTSPCDL